MSGPLSAVRRRMNSAASPVTATREGTGIGLEEAERVGGVAHQQVLRLLVVVEHHLVRLAADTGLLVPTECGMRRIGVVAVRPDATGLDLPAGPVGTVGVAGPDAGP